MDMKYYYNQFSNCLQDEKPYCIDSCPFSIDLFDFMDKMKRKRYNAAYKVLRNATVFPSIVAALCREYCMAECPRSEKGGPLQIRLLERTCIAKAGRKDPNKYNLPGKDRRVAIVGAGISGLACALRMASRKYDVTVYERSRSAGGQLKELLP